MAEADLRPMTLGEVLDRTFNLYKNNFWLFAGIIALPLLVNLIFTIGFTIWNSSTQVMTRSRFGQPTINPLYLGHIFIGVFVGAVLAITLIELGHAATIFAVSDLYLGREVSVRKAFSNLRGRMLRLFGVVLLSFLIIGAGFIALIVPGVILACRLAVAVPVSMLEDESPASAISRSMELTKGFGGQMFLIGLLVLILAWTTSAVFQTPFLVMAAVQKNAPLPLIFQILQHLTSFVSSVLVGPIGTIAFSLMYYNLRVRKEAFDLQHLMTTLGPSSGPAIGSSGAPSAV